MKRKLLLLHLPGLLLGTLAISACALINPINHYLSALLLIFSAIVLYFYIALVPAKRNWFDIRAIFATVWVATIGFAALRLTDYQRPWESTTWLILASAYAAFYAGATLGSGYGEKLYHRTKGKTICLKKYTFRLQETRLFWICFGVTIFGILCFAANVSIRGYIPYFARSGDTYLGFYTKFYIFCIASTMISGLSYYTLKNQKLVLWQKLFLWFSILYSTFLFPMLVVSRGAFLTSALALTTAIFYLNKKKLLVLALCAVVIVGFYMEGTKARGYSDAQLNAFFEPTTITLNGSNPNTTDTINATDATDTTDTTDPDSTGPNQNGEENNGNVKHFQLSGTASFLYSYLTVSHDNFNEAVRLRTDYSYGVRQLMPFNVILRSRALSQAISNTQDYLVRGHLNTINLAGYAYYDFGAVGVVLLMFIWSFAFGIMQAFVLNNSGPFSLMTLGNTMTPVTLCCFASWMSVFSNWMHWGFVFILFLIATVTKKSNHSETNLQ